MPQIFADTNYWIAILNPRDALHARALDVARQHASSPILTTEMVLSEVFASFARFGPSIRGAVVALEAELRRSSSVELVPQSRNQFRSACDLCKQREDKNWSLVDCASFRLMHERGLTDALTNDAHFEQAGFRALLR